MRTVRTALLAGVAMIAVAGFSGWAQAQSPQIHVMTIGLPGGGSEVIRYTGDIPPRVVVDTGAAAAAPSLAPSLFGPDSPFAELQRISAAMDRQMDAMLEETAALAAAPATPLTATDFAALPAGSQGYSFTSLMSGNGVCMRSMEITSTGNGSPRVVTRSSGDCAPTGGAAPTVGLPNAQQLPHRPAMIMTRADGAKPYAGLVREIPTAAER